MEVLTPLQLNQILSEAVESGQYLHWDKLRFKTPPSGLGHEHWWLGLKLRRLAQWRSIPLQDDAGASFRFYTTDAFSRALHEIDSNARGSTGAPDAVINPQTQRQYYMSSILEEAITSSQLEGAATTRDQAKQMIRAGRQPNTVDERMIFNNYVAMEGLKEWKEQEMSPRLLFEIHRSITDGTLDDPSACGRLRRPEEEIQVVDHSSGDVLHIPPAATGLEGRIEAMCEFANGDSKEGEPFIHPVLRAVMLHFWLAYEHPFCDGNGRTARALFYWMVLRRGYWLFEYLSISQILLKAPVKYGRSFLLTETDENDLNYFIEYQIEVIRRSIDELQAYILRKSIQTSECATLLRRIDTLNGRQEALLQHALRHPGVRYEIEAHQRSHRVAYATARSDLLALASLDLLITGKRGRRTIFEVPVDLADRIRRCGA